MSKSSFILFSLIDMPSISFFLPYCSGLDLQHNAELTYCECTCLVPTLKEQYAVWFCVDAPYQVDQVPFCVSLAPRRSRSQDGIRCARDILEEIPVKEKRGGSEVFRRDFI